MNTNVIYANKGNLKMDTETIAKKVANLKRLFFIAVSAIFFMTSFTTHSQQSLNKWKVGSEDINSSTFELRADQTAIYNGDVNGANFKNFNFKARITHSVGAKASFWIHSDANLSKGYSILIGKPANDRRRSGSLASVRNLYRSHASSFDLEVKVEGKRIVVMIDGTMVVDYLEPADPYRLPANAAQLLSSGVIGFRVESGMINVASADIAPLADNLPNYPADREPWDERDDTVIRLQQRNFPIVDFHVHPPRGMDTEALLAKSLEDGFEYGTTFTSAGEGYAISNDEQAREYFEANRDKPFFLTMQLEGREWVNLFSKEVFDLFDYMFTDPLTFDDHKGRRTRLWSENSVIIDIPEQEYMDMVMDRTLKIINEEPIDFLANPTLLSNSMMENYDKFWTDVRVAQFVKALKDNNVALEINARYKLPTARIINAAKAAGVKFVLGTNNGTLVRLEYSLQMVEECGLTIDDMWFPK